MIPCCLSIISQEEYENTPEGGLLGGGQGKYHRCPYDAYEAHELIQKMESNTCHFAIGYGARMAPCCLSIISREEYENRLEGGLVGGDQGKHHRCPNDANEAHELIQKMETNNKKGNSRFFTNGADLMILYNTKYRFRYNVMFLK